MVTTPPGDPAGTGGSTGLSTSAYLERLGVRELPALTSPFDPGYDAVTLEGHLEQSSHLMASLKISMACWMVAQEDVTRRKLAAARRFGVPTMAGGGPFEVAIAQGELDAYLDLCAGMGLTGIECAHGFTELPLSPPELVRAAAGRGLEVQFELGEKHAGAFTAEVVDELLTEGTAWLQAGAERLIIEARESALGVGLFDGMGSFNAELADRFVEAFGLDRVVFEAPSKYSQFAIMDHFGAHVRLGNVRLEELLRVEIYRRGLHSDAFANPRLRPVAPERVD
jgi:phosphosulfolactate synthase